MTEYKKEYLKYKSKYLEEKTSIIYGGNVNEITNFKINRNNSIIIPKKGEKNNLILYNNGFLDLKISSQYVPEADNLHIHENLKNLNMWGYYQYNVKQPKFLNIYFTHKKIRYELQIKLNWKNKEKSNMILSIFNKYNNPKNEWTELFDSMPYTLEHHFGTLIMFTTNILNYLIKGTKYYIVNGPWDTDTSGDYSIQVLEYNGVNDLDNEKEIDGKIYYGDILGKKRKKSSESASFITEEDGAFKVGVYPVHFIYEFRKKFKIPKGLPKANTLKDTGVNFKLV